MPQARRKPPPGASQPEEQPENVPEVEPRVRTSKFAKMETAVQGLYIMLGGALTVMPNEVAGQQIKRIGKSFAIHSEEIAEAWIDLAEDDVRVRRILESLTGFSTWGKVVGRHLEAIGDETPAIQGMRGRVPQQPQGGTQAEDVQAAMALAEFFAQSAAQSRAQNGQEEQAPPPPEQVRRAMQEQQRQQQRPVRQQQQQPVAQPQHPDQAPPMGQTRKPVGMPTPADLGVTIPDTPEDFPAGGSEDVRG